jgi:iron complex transport system substrate-binding protein
MNVINRIPRRTALFAGLVAAAVVAVPLGVPLVEHATASGASCPRRIVSISPTATESLFAIGAGARVVAVDSDSTYPSRAPRKAGLIAYSPNAEGILTSYHPDLVVVSYDANKVVENLRRAHVRVLFQPTAANLPVAYRQILNLGIVTCHGPQAVRVVHTMQRQITAIRRAAGTKAHGLVYYDEISAPPYEYAASSRSFIGQLFGLLGMRNITNDPSGFPQLGPEAVPAANPQMIFLSDNQRNDGGVTAAAVAKRGPSWRLIRAVKNHAIYGLNDDAASRWGPRVIVLMREISSAVFSYRRAHG